MEPRSEEPAEEIRRLRRCMNDLVGLLALPAIWSGGDSFQIARTLLDALAGMLSLDLVYIRLKDPSGERDIEMARFAEDRESAAGPSEVGEALDGLLGENPRLWPLSARIALGGDDLSIVPLGLGMNGEIGMIVAGSARSNFPEQTEMLLLGVASNQAAIGLQEARLLNEQRRLADNLDQQVGQRTAELAAVNEDLKKEIAERIAAEERLRLEERELKGIEARKAAILDSALDCIITMDHEGRIAEFNPAAERTFGYSREDVVGMPLSEVIIPPALRERHRAGMARYLSSEEARVLGKRVEMTAMRADGTEFPVEIAITRIPLDGPPAFTGYLRDITRRKRSEEELERSKAYLTEAQRLSQTGSFGWAVADDEHFWSEETFRIFEYEVSAKITLQRILDRVHPQDIPLMREAISMAASGTELDFECRLLMPNGSVKHLHIVAHAARGRDGRLEYVGAVRDVTERRNSEEALGLVRSELAHMARITSLGALTASIAHEVNQPLSGIITNASTCLRMLAADPPNVDGARETARRTIRDGNRASDVIVRLRALFSKKEAATEPVDLNEAARDVIALSISELQRNQIVLRLDLAEELPPVTGDRVQLQQVVLNLLLNASEAMRDVEDRPRNLTIRTGLDESGGVRLSVQDSGKGIAPQAAGRLFEAFYTTKDGGMGIGLSVCRSIVESHHGRIHAEPNEGPGATFAFSIPRERSSETGASSPDAAQPLAESAAMPVPRK